MSRSPGGIHDGGSVRKPAMILRFLHCLSILPGVIDFAPRLQALEAGTRPAYAARRAEGRIALDGHLDEPDWGAAPAGGGFSQVEPVQGGPVTFATDVRVVFDAENLYVGVFCHDTAGPRGVRVQDLRRKFDYFQNDLFGVSLDPLHDGRNAVAFQVTPYGTQRDLQVYDGAERPPAPSGWKAPTARPTPSWRHSSRAVPRWPGLSWWATDSALGSPGSSFDSSRPAR